MEAKETPEELFDFERTEVCSFEDYDKEEAKEKASILWLLSKAFDGIIPSELREPFYRDHEHRRHLKPKIVHSLANAELYCLALANIYSDPNYHNLDHHGIIQALMRKGVSVVESRDAPLTETTLVQTAPLKLSVHMCVIEGLISLYIKEVLIPEKVVDVVRSFAHVNIDSEMPSTPEEAAVLWINKCCVTLEQGIREEWGSREPETKLPRIPVLQEIADISDGCSLAAVICFYCPNHLSWQDVCWNDPMSLGDSIYNIQLVKRFCCDNLPRQIDFLMLEDFLYVHPSIKTNILVFVAELLFSFVIWPVSCVSRHPHCEFHEESRLQPEGQTKQRSSSIPSHKMHQTLSSAIPNLRADTYGGSTSSLPELKCGPQTPRESSEKQSLTRKSNDRIRMSPQLHRTNSSNIVNGYKSSSSSLTNSGDTVVRSSSGNIKENIAPSVPTETGLKTKELFTETSGDNRLSMGLEDYYHSLATEDGPIRSGSLSNIRDSKAWKNIGNVRPGVKSSASSQSSGICVSDTDNKILSKTSFAELSKDPDTRTHNINIVYMHHDRDGLSDKKSLKSGLLHKKPEKRTTFATLPNTTTWQQQRALSSSSSQADSGHETPVETADPALNIQLANLRMKLEEKRRKIELEKKRMEALWKRERQKIGKAAFLQAVTHSVTADAGTPDSGTGRDDEEQEVPLTLEKSVEHVTSSPSMVRRMSMQEIAEDLDTVQKKWLEKRDVPVVQHPSIGMSVNDGDGGGKSAEDYAASIEQLNSSLCDLQADISRITIQQEHVENLMQDSVEDASHFFLHRQPNFDNLQESPVRNYLWNKPVQQPASSYTARAGNFSPYTMSPQRQTYNRQSSLSEKRVSDIVAKPALPSSPPVTKREVSINLDELYSKVIKPESRTKVDTSPKGYGLPDERDSVSAKQMQKQVESPSRKVGKLRERGVGEASSESAHSVQPVESEQGFYISFEDQPKKSTTKWQRPPVPPSKKEQVAAVTKDEETSSFGFVIGADLVHPDPETEIEMAKKKELIMNLSIKRRADHECRRAAKEQEYAQIREEERKKKEMLEKKREEERQRRQAILEQYRQRKILEELEKEGGKETTQTSKPSGSAASKSRSSICSSKKPDNRICSDFTKPIAELRNQMALRKAPRTAKPRPKSAFVTSTSGDPALMMLDGGIASKRSSQLIAGGLEAPDFDVDSLNSTSTSTSSRERGHSPSSGRAVPSQQSPTRYSCDSDLRPCEGATRSSDGASDTTSNSSNAPVANEYTGPRLFVKPTAKSNRGIIINAVNTVLAGAVNSETKRKVVEEINKSDSKHFLILFRDAGCQFRAIYSFNPDTEEVIKLYGIGPKAVSDKVMEKFYKYNSGGKCFSEVQTKHLTVTIDAFTIPNSLWAGKKTVPLRKEFF